MVMSILQSPTEWGPVGAVAKVEQLPPANSRSSEASRSDDGSSAAHPSKSGTPKTSTGVIIGGISLTDDGATKKKRGPKFLVKQFGMITKPANASPRRNFKLLGQDYVVPIPGSRAVASTNDSVSVDADLKVDNRDGNANAEPSNNSVITRTEPVLEQQGNVTEEPPMEFVGVSTDFKIDKPGVVKEQHRNVARPPIEFVTVPVDFKQEKRGVVDRPPIEFVTMPVDFKKGNRRVVREDRPVDFVPRCSPRVGPHVRLDSMLRNHSSEESSPSVSGRLSYSQVDSPRSQRSVLSIPETIMSSIEHEVYSEDNLKPHSRTSLSSLAEWSSHSLERRGELSIAGLSIGEGRNIAGISRRTDVTSAQSPNRSDTQALDYGPDDTDSGVEMYHETTSASPGSYASRRSSCSLSEEWASEVEDSDGLSHHERRTKHRNAASLSSYSYSGSRYSASTSDGNRGNGGYYNRKRNDSSLTNSTFSSRGAPKKRDGNSTSGSKLAVQFGKHGNRKDRVGSQGQFRTSDDTAIPLDSISPQEAIAVFHDEVAQMMFEEGLDCCEANDVEEFLDGYMRLRSPFYLSMVDDFFRAVCVDCYKRPVDLPVESTPPSLNRLGSSITSSKSTRSESQAHNLNLA